MANAVQGHALHDGDYIGEMGDRIPEKTVDGLKHDQVWICWRFEEKDGRKTKVPISAKSTNLTGTNDKYKNDRVDFEEADLTRNNYMLDGVGFVVPKNMFFLDIDNRPLDDEYSKKLLDLFDTYTEYSPSGKGVHLYGLIDPDQLPPEYPDGYYQKNPNLHIEMYIGGYTNRFATFTGNIVRDKPLTDCTSAVLVMLSGDMKKTDTQKSEPAKTSTAESAAPAAVKTTQADWDIVEAIRKQSNGEKFHQLFDYGRWQEQGYKSQSEADIALCSMIYFRTQDPAQIERIFLQSSLGIRDKAKRPDYIRSTINTAISNYTGEVYDPDYGKKQNTAGNAPGTHENEQTGSDGKTHGDDQNGESEPAPCDAWRKNAEFLSNFSTEIFSEKYKPLPTGISSIDETLGGGFLRQTLNVVSGPPGTAKTSFCTQMIEALARAGQPCVYVNLEMSESQLVARSVARICFTQLDRKLTAIDVLQSYRLTAADQEIVRQGIEIYNRELSANMAYHSAPGDANLDTLMKKLENVALYCKTNNKMPPICCVDYLQLLHTNDRIDAAEIVKRAVVELKSFAVRNNTIVILISAQSRDVNRLREATQASARDSSAVEYTADTQLQLLKHYNDESDKKSGYYIEVNLTKSRFTPIDEGTGQSYHFYGGQSYLRPLDSTHGEE